MSVEYVLPREKAVTRMKAMLFKPFRLETWLTLGLAAFLAQLSQLFWEWSSNGLRFTFQGNAEAPAEWMDWIRSVLAEPFWLFVAAVVLVLVVVISTVLLWVSCRARFVFLDDVVRDRVAIVDPWRRHARLGDSLFLWIVACGLVFLVLWSALILPFAVTFVSAWTSGFGPAMILALALFGVVALALGVIGAYVRFFLGNFVVPIMYRDGITATRAWGRFLPLLRANLFPFVLCGLWVLVLWIAVVLALGLAGCATCCCGFLLMALPYVGSVLLLPITVSYRAFGPEFLARFGPEWSVFEPPPGTAGPAPPSPEGPPAPLAPPGF
jgi:hypothetical protein